MTWWIRTNSPRPLHHQRPKLTDREFRTGGVIPCDAGKGKPNPQGSSQKRAVEMAADVTWAPRCRKHRRTRRIRQWAPNLSGKTVEGSVRCWRKKKETVWGRGNRKSASFRKPNPKSLSLSIRWFYLFIFQWKWKRFLNLNTKSDFSGLDFFCYANIYHHLNISG